MKVFRDMPAALRQCVIDQGKLADDVARATRAVSPKNEAAFGAASFH